MIQYHRISLWNSQIYLFANIKLPNLYKFKLLPLRKHVKEFSCLANAVRSRLDMNTYTWLDVFRLGLKSFIRDNDNICKLLNQFPHAVRNDRQDPLNTMNMEIYVHVGGLSNHVCIFTGIKQTWEIGRFSMITRRYLGKREGKKSLRIMKSCWIYYVSLINFQKINGESTSKILLNKSV